MTPTVRAILACGGHIKTTRAARERVTIIYVVVPRQNDDLAFQVELTDLERYNTSSQEQLEWLVEEKLIDAIKKIYDNANTRNLKTEQRIIAHERVQGQD